MPGLELEMGATSDSTFLCLEPFLLPTDALWKCSSWVSLDMFKGAVCNADIQCQKEAYLASKELNIQSWNKEMDVWPGG